MFLVDMTCDGLRGHAIPELCAPLVNVDDGATIFGLEIDRLSCKTLHSIAVRPVNFNPACGGMFLLSIQKCSVTGRGFQFGGSEYVQWTQRYWESTKPDSDHVYPLLLLLLLQPHVARLAFMS